MELLSSGRALLLSGPEPSRGLPFFPRNALRALRGEYLLSNGRVRVWSCRELLVFGSEWRPADSETLRASGYAVLSLSRAEGPVLAFRGREFALFLEPAADGPAFRRFALALLRRFSFFFDNAVDDAELSFPAFVDY